MAEDDLDDDLEEEEGDEESGERGGASGGKKGKKKLIVLVALPLLLVIGGVAAAYFTGMLDSVIGMVAGGEEEAAPASEGEVAALGEGVYFDLPELLVNLNTGGRKSSFLKMRVVLVLRSEKDVPEMEKVMPRIIDNFQVYLRELRIEDLKGSAGMYRLREELLTRVNAAVQPAKVNDILFREMLVQ